MLAKNLKANKPEFIGYAFTGLDADCSRYVFL